MNRAITFTPHRVGMLRTLAVLAALALLAVAGRAHANCLFFNSDGGSTVAFTPPATITLPGNLPSGTQTVLWTSAPVSPSRTLTLWCQGRSNSGIVNAIAAQPTGNDTLFPTYIPNLYYRILHPDASTLLRAYPNYPLPPGQQRFSVPSELQLVATGPITGGSTLAAGQLAQWQVQTWWRGSDPVEIFQTNASVTFTSPGCTVAVDPTVVVLPTVMASVFNGTGATAGQTPFNVQLHCQSRVRLSITLATNAPAPGLGNDGVIAPTRGGGYAQGVGVQILDANGNPVTFGTAIPAGTTGNGAFNLFFYARYYQTGANVSGGKVAATATYTLTYQ